MAINPNPGLAGYTELRRDLMHLADEFNKKRLELIEVQTKINEGILALVNMSEHLFTRSLSERTADGDLKAEFKTDTDVKAVADHMDPSRRTRAQAEPTIDDEGNVVKKGKRGCGLCHKPGHRRANCPEAHLIREKDIAAKAENGGKKKRKMKPLSPERKAQLAKTLEKARAARKGGKK